MTVKAKFLAVLAGFFLTLSSAAAAPVSFIDNGTYTSDTQSGLEWLDVNLTAGRNYFDVSSELGSGGEFEGWRYATAQEFLGLISNWTGITVTVQHQVVFAEGLLDGLVSLLGPTSGGVFAEGSNNYFIRGVLADKVGDWHHQSAFIYDMDHVENDADYIYGNGGPYSDYSIEGKYGAFLVRDIAISAVPLPPAILMFGAAIIGLGLISRKRFH
ncbi:hypothetical protein [Sneathiella limimaris]|uniref:hypothetical protein n=1 Tax=Sneathiella limimaris TaxID=1964213 RepID=UPI00146F42D6|nr:hypothetical protein [Sneathiella limimaris]